MCTFLNVFDNCSEKTFWKAAPAEKLGISATPFSEFFNNSSFFKFLYLGCNKYI